MANLIATSEIPIFDGMLLTLRAACDCTAIEGLTVYYPSVSDNAMADTSKAFTFKDAHGNTLTGIGNLFSAGAYIRVILDTTNNFAYIQNADTNGYIEATKVSKSGDTMTGRLGLNGVTLTEGVDFGTSLPAPGLPGRLLFLKAEE